MDIPEAPRGALMIFQNNDGAIYVCQVSHPSVDIDFEAVMSDLHTRWDQPTRVQWSPTYTFTVRGRATVTVYADYETFMSQWRPTFTEPVPIDQPRLEPND